MSVDYKTGVGKGRRPITQELYQKLLDSFRQDPGSCSLAAQRAGVAFKTAQRGWMIGWPDKEMPAISKVVVDEQVLVRASAYELEMQRRMQEEASHVLSKAKEDAEAKKAEILSEVAGISATVDAAKQEAEKIKLDAREEAAARLKQVEQESRQRLAELSMKAKIDAAEEARDRAQIVIASRKGAMVASALPVLVLQDSIPLVAKMLRDAILEGKFKSPTHALRAAEQISRMFVLSQQAVNTYLDVANKHAGKPTEILAIQIDDSVEEIEKETEAVQRAIERARQKKQAANGLNGTNGAGTPTLVH